MLTCCVVFVHNHEKLIVLMTNHFFMFCFPDQLRDREDLHYSLTLWRKHLHHREVVFDQCSVKLSDWLSTLARGGTEVVSDANDETSLQNCREFSFLLLKGDYRVRFQSCDPTNFLNATTIKSPDEKTSLKLTSSSVLRCDESNEVTKVMKYSMS